MLPLHPISTRTNTLFPYTTLFRSTARRHHVDPADTVCPTHRNLPAHLWPVQNQNTGNRCRQQEREKAHHRSEEHTSELQSLMRISYAVFCLKKKNLTHHSCLYQLYILDNAIELEDKIKIKT